MPARELTPAELTRRCDAATLDLELPLPPAPAAIVGQPRATAAVEYAISTARDGHHLFVAGPPGSGRRALVRHAVQARVHTQGVRRSDWVYVHQFAQPHKPIALELPAGRGAALRNDMQSLVRDLRTMIRTMFESEEYATEVERIDAEFKEHAEQAFIEVGKEAQRRGLAMVRTPVGFTVAPQKDGEVMPPQVFESLPEAERTELQQAMAEVQEQLVRALRASMRLRKDHADRVRELNRSMTRVAAEHAMEEIRGPYADLPRVIAWFDTVCADVVDHADDFRATEEDGSAASSEEHTDLSRYEVNLLRGRDRQRRRADRRGRPALVPEPGRPRRPRRALRHAADRLPAHQGRPAAPRQRRLPADRRRQAAHAALRLVGAQARAAARRDPHRVDGRACSAPSPPCSSSRNRSR